MPEHTGAGESIHAAADELRIVAMLAWFNEDPAILERAVTSAATIADTVIAVDGGWNLYPGARPSSPPEQHAVIMEAGLAAGLKIEIYPGQQWTGQVQKRNRMLWLASNGSDWIMPLDADWELQGDRNAIRTELATTKADALTVPFHTPANPDADLDDVAATDWHRNMAGHTVHEPLIWRTLDNMKVENHHWVITGEKNGHRVALWGNPGGMPQADTADLKARFQINHWCLHRDQRTIQANRAYCNDRAEYVREHGTEPL